MLRNAFCSDLDERKRLITGALQEVAAGYKKHSLFERPIGLFSEEIWWMTQQGILTPNVWYVELAATEIKSIPIQTGLTSIL
jgi:hypothetical protein